MQKMREGGDEIGFAGRSPTFMPRGKVWEIGRTAGLFADPRTAEFGQFGGSELLAYWPAN